MRTTPKPKSPTSGQAPRKADRAHDFLRELQTHPLTAVFAPSRVAVIGATDRPDSVGRTIMENLKSGGFAGSVYPVNPKHPTVLGIKAYPSIAAVPETPDLAVIVTPAATVPGVVGACSTAGVRAAVIISAGFKEIGPAGAQLEQEILARARRTNMRIIGPNCLGVMVPHTGFNATFAAKIARPGSVGFISQSGALCTAILDWSFGENVGFSAFASLGSMLDVGWGDIIYYLGDDPHTRSIVIYMESVGDARAFLSAAREVALTKPIIVIKVGRTAQAAKAAASHTGSLTGSDDVLEAAFRRAGVLRVDTIAELFEMADVLGKQPRPRGPRLAIVTNAGGPGALATDMLITSGGQLAGLSAGTNARLDAFLPPHWSHGNPVDMIGDASPATYAKTVEAVAEDHDNDGLLVVLTPQAMTRPAETAEALRPFAKLGGKPILASWMGGPEVDEGRRILSEAGIPTFDYPDTAARAFEYMWRYSDRLRLLYETPSLVPESEETAVNGRLAAEVIDQAWAAGRTVLDEAASKRVIEAYGIPVVPTRVATSEQDAVALAGETGGPVALKVFSHTITHKSDVGGVHLDVRGARAVRRAFRDIKAAVERHRGAEGFQGVTVQAMVKSHGIELILGSSIDPQFGPVLLFGAGGQLVEVMRDRALGLPPLNATLARRLMEGTRIYSALKGVRGRAPVDLAALDRLLVRFSRLVLEHPWISQIDINPLLASSDGLVALDARVILHSTDTPASKLPRPAIRPYPTQYEQTWKFKGKTPVTIRPIRPEDEPLMAKFHQSLSDRTVYQRYFTQVQLSQRIAHERLVRICFNDYDREIALVAERKLPRSGEREILGVGRLSKLRGVTEAEFSITIADPWQGQGLGTQFLKRLVEIGRIEGLNRITAHILPQNTAMQRVCKKVGFALHRDDEADEIFAEISL